MLSKSAVVFTAVAALSEQAVAFNSHRHLHREAEVEQRDVVHTDWHTVLHTVIVTAGQEAPAPTPDVVVVEAPVVPEAEAEAPPPPAAPTTLATSVVAPAPSEEPEPEEPEEPTPSPPSGGGSGLRSKRGMAFNDANMANFFGSACESCSWGYNWGSSAPGFDTGSFSYCPMLWGDQSPHIDYFAQAAEEAISNGAPALFSFNEPDHSTQSNMPAGQAAASHVQHLNQYAGRVPIGAPSITNSGEPGQGLQWLQAFVDACDALDEPCHYDFCNVHWYSESPYADTLFEHIRGASEICGGKPIWLTEFGIVDDQSNARGFIEEVIPKLEAMDELEAYSYFWVAENFLMSGPNSLSDSGNAYASL